MLTLNAAMCDRLLMVRAEFNEMPGLHLTRIQVQRLWNLDGALCSALLDALVADKFLRRTSRDTYLRADAGA